MRLCDVTVHAAEQRHGRTHTVTQRVEAGRALDRLEIPLVAAGEPAADDTAAETVEQLSDDISADVVAFSRATTEDVAAALDANPDIVEIRIPVSDRQLESVLGVSRDEAFDMAERAVLRAREGGVDVHLSLSDAFRAEVPAIAGAFGRFDCPIVLDDSVGARTPPFVAGFLRTLADASADLTRAGVRFRDDLGCATANAIIAAETGIERVDVSVASLGEGAGLPATEEVIVATEAGGGDAGVITEETIPACEDVLRSLEENVGEQKAILGEAVTKYGPGRADDLLDDPAAFESFDPAAFGGRRQLSFGAETGRDAAETLLERAGTDATDRNIDILLGRLAEKGPLGLEAALSLAEDV